MRCLIAGSGSEIASELATRLEADGWEVHGMPGKTLEVPKMAWDLLILSQGQLSPIGKFIDCHPIEWMNSIMVNGLLPLQCVRLAWQYKNKNATVIFMGGPNMTKTSPTYTAYRVGKGMLESIVGTLNEEYPEVRFRILHPGVVKTKIHNETLKAGRSAANYERVFKIMNGAEPTVSHNEVYEKLKALL